MCAPRAPPGIEYPQALSATGRDEPLHGFPTEAMTHDDIDATVPVHAVPQSGHQRPRRRVRGVARPSRPLPARGRRRDPCNLPAAKAIRAALQIPVLCTGGFQTAEIIRDAIRQQFCDAVTIGRPLIANNDLVQQFADGRGRPAVPCTYCNRCLVNAVENPLGCYDVTRFPTREAMVAEIMSVFTPAPFE